MEIGIKEIGKIQNTKSNVTQNIHSAQRTLEKNKKVAPARHCCPPP